MTLSIRTRLTLLIAVVFFVVLVCVLTAGAVAFYLGVTEDTDTVLTEETKRMSSYLESDYPLLVSGETTERDTLLQEFVEDMEELHEGTRRFAIFVFEADSAREIVEAGIELQRHDTLLDRALSRKETAFYYRMGETLYRTQTSRHTWGMLVMGVENPVLLTAARQLSKTLLIVIPLTLIMVLAGGRFLARRVMKPVLVAARSAESITVTNLSNRLPEYSGGDEFGVLLSTFNQMIERLDSGVSRMRRFTQDAAHELRSPLTILRGELELSYQREQLPDDLRDSLRKSLDRTIGMSKMVENLLMLAQSDSDRFTLKKTPVQFDKVLMEIVEDLNLLVEGHPVTVTVDRCDAVVCLGDVSLIRRLLLNLTDNALKNTLSGRITFTLIRQADQLECTIHDTGVGIPEADLPHVFDRFYRADTARSRDSGGSGLGLAICQWIVTVHGGSIRIESAVSKGTTVLLTLPLAPN